MPDALLIYFDGGARGNPGPAAIGAVVYDASASPPQRLATVSERIGETTNNVAEYRALIAGLERASEAGVSELEVFSDSELMVKQMLGEYRVKNPALQELFLEASRGARRLHRVTFTHVRRERNELADSLVNEALDASKPT
jgi:ribonuclease HI